MFDDLALAPGVAVKATGFPLHRLSGSGRLPKHLERDGLARNQVRRWRFPEVVRLALASPVVNHLRLSMEVGIAAADAFMDSDTGLRWGGKKGESWAEVKRKPGELFPEGRTLIAGLGKADWHVLNAPETGCDVFTLYAERKARRDTFNALAVVEADVIVRRVITAFELFGE